MKRLITGFAVGALALTLFVPQVSSNYAFAAETGVLVVVKDGKVNGTPVDQYILEEVANGRELSEVVSKLIDGGASAGDVVVAAIAAGISPANAAGAVTKAVPAAALEAFKAAIAMAPEFAADIAGAVTKAAPNYAVEIVNAAIAAKPESTVEITQAVLNEVDAGQAAAIKKAAVDAVQNANLDNSNVILNKIGDLNQASPS